MKFKAFYKKIKFSKRCFTCRHYIDEEDCTKYNIKINYSDYCKAGWIRSNTRLSTTIEEYREKNKAIILKKKIGFKDWRDR